MHEDLSGLPDDDFFRSPFSTAGDVRTSLTDEDFMGVAISAPHVIDASARATLPLLSYRRCSMEEADLVPYAEHAVLIGVDLERNIAYAGLAKKANENQIGSAISRPPPKGTSFEYHLSDAADQLGMPWRTGKYLFTVVMRDQPSNRVEVELGTSPKAYRDEEVAKFIEAQKGQPAQKPVYPPPGIPLPSYARTDDSPALPDEPGIAIKVARVSRISGDLRLPLSGAFRVTALPHEIVPDPVIEEPVADADIAPTVATRGIQPVSLATEGQAASPAPTPDALAQQPPAPPNAIVPITLVVTGSETGFVTSFTLRAPSFTEIDKSAPDPVVTGFFAIDLLSIPGMTRTAQTYFIYAVSGRFLGDAVLAALVAID